MSIPSTNKLNISDPLYLEHDRKLQNHIVQVDLYHPYPYFVLLFIIFFLYRKIFFIFTLCKCSYVTDYTNNKIATEMNEWNRILKKLSLFSPIEKCLLESATKNSPFPASLVFDFHFTSRKMRKKFFFLFLLLVRTFFFSFSFSIFHERIFRSNWCSSIECLSI